MKKRNLMNYFDQQGERHLDNFFQESSYYEDNSYNNFAGANGVGKLADYDRTLTIEVVNSTLNAQTAIIFGAYEYPGTGDSFQPAGIAVNVLESSHDQVRDESRSRPFKVVAWKLFVSSGGNGQLSNQFTFRKKTAQGLVQEARMQPINYRAASDNQDNLIESRDFQFDVTGGDAITFSINASTTIRWVLYISEKVAPDRFLNNEAAILTNGKGMPGQPVVKFKQIG